MKELTYEKTDSDPQKYIYLNLHNVHFKKFPNNMFTLLNKKANNERLRIHITHMRLLGVKHTVSVILSLKSYTNIC